MPTKNSLTVNQLQHRLYSVICQVKILDLAVGAISPRDSLDEDVQNGFSESLHEAIDTLKYVSKEMTVFKDPLTPKEIRQLIEQVDEKTNGKSKEVIPLVTA